LFNDTCWKNFVILVNVLKSEPVDNGGKFAQEKGKFNFYNALIFFVKLFAGCQKH